VLPQVKGHFRRTALVGGGKAFSKLAMARHPHEGPAQGHRDHGAGSCLSHLRDLQNAQVRSRL